MDFAISTGKSEARMCGNVLMRFLGERNKLTAAYFRPL